MTIPKTKTPMGNSILSLVLFSGLVSTTACSSVDEGAASGRVEHPPGKATEKAAATASAQAAAAAPAFTPLDKTIAEACVHIPGLPDLEPVWPRQWSQNVPERDCTSDDECGDGFCDRGRCSAIWTCVERHGQRCIDGRVYPRRHDNEKCDGLCLEGRCRSCVSDEECAQVLGIPNAVCLEAGVERKGRRCTPLTWGLGIDREIPTPIP
jgi:hypothetical protein